MADANSPLFVEPLVINHQLLDLGGVVWQVKCGPISCHGKGVILAPVETVFEGKVLTIEMRMDDWQVSYMMSVICIKNGLAPTPPSTLSQE